MKYIIDQQGTVYFFQDIFVNNNDDTIEIIVKTSGLVTIVITDQDNKIQSAIKQITLTLCAGAQVHCVETVARCTSKSVVLLHLEKDSFCEYQFLSTVLFIQREIIVNCCDYGASANISGVYVITDNNTCRITTKQKHTVSHTQSTVLVTGVVSGKGSFLYEGNIHIAHNAKLSVVHQKNTNIVIGDHAQVYARPALQVDNKNVVCSHASATGRLDQKALLFARARGLDKRSAQKMLLRGFLCATISNTWLQKKLDIALHTL